ncbi:MAG TPA: carboxypeptidase regulatory-like domain-containing protein [Bryobacteraceae bacterium]|nr:carboxypeptidase regulatory-like domain-containing protein [Bryobacteraceae bacterium]
MGKRLPGIGFVVVCLATAIAQVTTSRLEGTVTDSSGALVPSAKIQVTNVSTGQQFASTTNERGEFVVVAVPAAVYRVSATATGFRTSVTPDVKVEVGVPATVNFVLEVGSVSDVIEVSGVAEVLQTSTATVASTLTGRQIVELPFTSRNALELIVTQPGTATPGTPRTSSINGLPKGSLNITIDGINIQDNLLRSDDGFFASIQPRADAVEEVTVVTAAAGAESLGEGAAQIRFVTRAGTNSWHGGLFWQHRNDYLNANYYFNTVDRLPRDRLILNQFGGRLGGPIRRNKAFFFVNFEEFRLPQVYNSGAVTILSDSARRGIFTYLDSTRTLSEVNLYEIAARKNPTLPGSVRPYPTSPDPQLAASYDLISRLTSAGSGTVRSRVPTNSDYNRNDFNFQTPARNKRHFPTMRLDYNVTEKHHLEGILWYQSFTSIPDGVNSVIPFLPGTGTVLGTDVNAGVRQIKFTGSTALRSTLTPRLTSEIRFGLAGGNSLFREQITPELFSQWQGYAITMTLPASTTAYLTNPYNGSSQSRRNSPVKQFSSTLAWFRDSHLLTFGGGFTQINLYQQTTGTQNIPTMRFSVATNDPVNTGATTLFDTTNFPNSTPTQRNEAAALYSALTGRVANIGRSVSLSEETKLYEAVSSVDRNRQREFALYLQDNWRLRPGFALNVGARWDVQFPFENLSGTYTTTGGRAGAYGISGTGNLFRPGVLAGTVPQFNILEAGAGAYRTYWKNVQPSVGIVYSVPALPSLLRWFSGRGGKAVVRSGYSIATVREGMNTFVNILGSNQGRTLSLTVNPDNFPAEFGPPGSVWFRDGRFPSRSFRQKPAFPLPVSPGNSVNEFDDDLRMGYVQSWSFSIQRELTRDMVLDVRYVGNHGTGLWRQVNLNEVNIFENGFLDEFRVARRNLAIARGSNAASTNFGNQGLPGQGNIPILQTALGFSSDTTIANQLLRGEAGVVANGIAFNATRMGRLTAAGYPENLFVVNPAVLNGGAYLIMNSGHSTYNALQAEVRRRLSGGLMLQGSYAFAKALSNMLASSSVVFNQPTTFRNPGLDKGPSPWDVRHGLKLNWIYELPFGPGRAFLNRSGALGRFVEGWEIASVTRIQSGSPLYLRSGRQTFNSASAQSNSADSGVVLHNLDRRQLQEMVAIRKVPVAGSGQSTIVYYLPQQLIDNTLAAFESGGKSLADLDRSKPYIGPPTEAGVLGQRVFLYGPWQNHWDFSLLKKTRVGENRDIELRAQFLNAFNITNFLMGSAANEVNTTAISSSFGQTRSAYRDFTVSGTNNPGGRLIELVLRFNF